MHITWQGIQSVGERFLHGQPDWRERDRALKVGTRENGGCWGRWLTLGKVFPWWWSMFFYISTWLPFCKGDIQWFNCIGELRFFYFSCLQHQLLWQIFQPALMTKLDRTLLEISCSWPSAVYGPLLALLTLLHHSIQRTNTFANFYHMFAPIYWCKRHGSTNKMVELCQFTMQ